MPPRFGFAVFLVLAFLPPALRAQERVEAVLARARDEGLSGDPQWRRLLHYKKGLFQWVSEEDAPGFFLSPRGKRDPEAELEAAIRGFFDPPSSDDEKRPHPQCRFPARSAWLKERLNLSDDFDQPCPRFEAWMARLDPESVTLVFASAYLANPASMYGHTFLRLNRRGRPAGERLNDYCVNFAAETDTRNGIAFAVKGLLGGYDGKFTTLPYYMQVQKYTNIESRDLWEYDLNLSSTAVDRLVRHLWEMGEARFNYFFLTENCAYALLPLLEASDVRLDLSDQFHLRVIPADTVRVVLDEPMLAGEGQLRPAQIKTILARRKLLTPPERAAAESIGKEQDWPALESFAPARRALVLDSSLDLFRLRHGFARFQSLEADNAERRILLARGAVPVNAAQVPFPVIAPENPPTSGHRTGRIMPGAGRSRGSLFYELSLRPALHDLLEDPGGYVPASRLDMFHLVLRRREDRDRLYVQRFAVVDVQSLSPWDPWVVNPSWTAFLGLDVAEDRPRPPDNALALRAGYGKGFSAGRTGPGGILAYGLAEGDAGAGPVFDKSFRTGAGATGGALWRPWARCRLWGEAGFWRYFWGDVDTVVRGTAGVGLDLTTNTALRAVFRRDGDARESLFSLAIYL